MGASADCGAGRHRACPGYYKTTHTCGCGCHTPPAGPLVGYVGTDMAPDAAAGEDE